MDVEKAVGTARARADGKLFRVGARRWYLKGLTYGPFAPNADGHFLPERMQLLRDFEHLHALGASALRLYHLPSIPVLEAALSHGLRVMLDVPWEKHRCFFEDRTAQTDALREVQRAARDLGGHPAVFAVSVANEIPHDVVRFYGARRVARFIDDLLAAAKDLAPDCLVTYTNYPSTEFLAPRRLDFYCANVYLDDADALSGYLDRLQHVAGTLPLVLGEHGVDSFGCGAEAQARGLARHVDEVFRRGLAGSFVFSYTDDWFTGGHPVEGWAFGVTDRRRAEKPSADALRRAWARAAGAKPSEALPRVSVVVCSFNGGGTLEECLRSMASLDYPDYEVILVDDGSTDDTPSIAARFPAVRYLRQENRGLSAARNAGLGAATGDIVAYTDSDCVADESWLLYLVRAMRDQRVEAIGGPNVPPPSDGWVARCVAASPGGPSHVMIDDLLAEHVPGCNMAFDRRTLLGLGGFDEQFRVAGDDVDVCWRLHEGGFRIGYAASALVWHHRRSTVGAYLRQQKGYGRSEALLQFKHPQRFNRLGASRWNGVIYGDSAAGAPATCPTVYHGQFGSGLFQIIYRDNRYSVWSYFLLLEWHGVALLMLALAAALWPLAPWPLVGAGVFMAGLSLAAGLQQARAATLPPGAPAWCRPLVFALRLAQPVVRSYHRHRYRLSCKRTPPPDPAGAARRHDVKQVSGSAHDLYWSSDRGQGRERLLPALVEHARGAGWRGDFHAEWHAHDVELWPDPWHKVRLHTATEELGGPRRFTRLRCALATTSFARTTGAVILLLLAAAALAQNLWVAAPAAALLAALFARLLVSRHRCRRSVSALARAAGRAAGLDAVYAPFTASETAVADEPGAAETPACLAVPPEAADAPDDDVPAVAC